MSIEGLINEYGFYYLSEKRLYEQEKKAYWTKLSIFTVKLQIISSQKINSYRNKKDVVDL